MHDLRVGDPEWIESQVVRPALGEEVVAIIAAANHGAAPDPVARHSKTRTAFDAGEADMTAIFKAEPRGLIG